MAALLSGNWEGSVTALDRLASWRPGVAEKAANPNVELHDLVLSILPDLVLEDVRPEIRGT
ncbi:hypothetical protein [Streptomyces wuyuanensis]|uniref:hypothetical protein n=1 Tax=Streptomyces wuyuanensis TaxID=1196353 RepID=UPI003719C7CF